MNFASAVFAMERGHKVKRKHWGGYWCLEDGELIMHCQNGRVLNLRESEDMIYTLRNMSCNDWEIVE